MTSYLFQIKAFVYFSHKSIASPCQVKFVHYIKLFLFVVIFFEIRNSYGQVGFKQREYL